MRITRTSGQDPGVDARADVVLATSALEVGFDDDQVGMIVQHKAPRSAASFLQRKGRAGRRAGMRPWTIVVLSEHGRDRWAFRDSERLFSPNLDRLSLPVFNPYVLRIQATWFLVDWIAKRVGHGVPNLYLARPDYFDPVATGVVRQLVEDLAQREQLTLDVADWLRHAQGGLGIADPESLARDILWKPPRAVLRQVVPVLWNHLEGDPHSPSGVQHKRVLPQFLPERTWDVLDVQDVELTIAGIEGSQSMDVGRALREAIPGRVSRRYAVGRDEQSKWLSWSSLLLQPTPPTDATVDQLLSEYVTNDDLPGVRIYQPTRLELSDVPSGVKNSSNAEWNWHLHIACTGQRGFTALPIGPIARCFIEDASTWLHRDRSWVRVYRYATTARYELLLDKGNVKRGVVRVVSPAHGRDAEQPAVGFMRAVDGIELHLRRDIVERVVDPAPEVVAALRPIFFRYLAMNSELLRSEASAFGINLLVSSAVGMIVATALRNRIGLEEAWALIPNKGAAAIKVLQSVLAGEVDDDGHGQGLPDSRGTKDVLALWSNAAIAAEMELLVAVLWQGPDDRWRKWLRSVFLETIRAAIETSVQSLLPEVPENDFSVEVLDVESRTSIMILEADAGGVGILDRLLAETSADATLFDTAVETALRHCRSERLMNNVLDVLRHARRKDSELESLFQSIRHSESYSELQTALVALVESLAQSGCDADKEAVTALAGKVLMPGSGIVTDRWIRGLTNARAKATQRVSIAIDTRLWAYWVLSSAKRRRLMSETLRVMHGQVPSDAQMTHSVTRLTLDPCRDSCPECLGTFKELQGLLPSRRLAQHWLNLIEVDQVIQVDSTAKWIAELDAALVSGTRIRLRYVEAERDQVSAALISRLASQFDRGYALAGFRLVSVFRVSGGWETHLRVDDVEAG